MLKKVLLTLVLVGLVVVASAFTLQTKDRQSTVTVTTATPVTSEKGTEVSIKSQKVLKVDVGSSKVILLNTPVFMSSVNAIIEELENIKNNSTKVYLVIDSPGGSVIDGARLISYMESSSLEINTVCESLCASMAAQIFEAGRNRYMVNRSILMFHQASGGTRGTLEGMLSQLTMIKLYVDRLDASVAARAGLDYTEFKQKIAYEYWLEAADAVDTRLADQLISISYKKSGKNTKDIQEILKSKGIEIPVNVVTPRTLHFN